MLKFKIHVCQCVIFIAWKAWTKSKNVGPKVAKAVEWALADCSCWHCLVFCPGPVSRELASLAGRVWRCATRPSHWPARQAMRSCASVVVQPGAKNQSTPYFWSAHLTPAENIFCHHFARDKINLIKKKLQTICNNFKFELRHVQQF